MRGVNQDERKSFLATALSRALKAKGWNQSDLAREATARMPRNPKRKRGIARDMVWQYINGYSLPRPEHLAAIATALGMKEEDLLPPKLSKQAAPGGIGLESLADGRVHLRVSKTLPMETALQIMALIERAK